jgi:hypothetical protein
VLFGQEKYECIMLPEKKTLSKIVDENLSTTLGYSKLLDVNLE